jgi:hypothetical protein
MAETPTYLTAGGSSRSGRQFAEHERMSADTPLAPPRAGRADGSHARRQPRVPPKFYRIGEVIEYSGVSRQTIHNYTTMGLLRESRRTAGGHRLYDASVFGRLETISELKARKKSLEEIRHYFAKLDGQV